MLPSVALHRPHINGCMPPGVLREENLAGADQVRRTDERFQRVFGKNLSDS